MTKAVSAARVLAAALCKGFPFLLVAGCAAKEVKPHHIVEAASTPELELLTKAVDSYDRGLYSISGEAWTELRDSYPSSYYSLLAELKIADSFFYSSKYSEALVAYEEFARLHQGHKALPYVYFQIGDCYWQQYQDALHDQGPLLAAVKEFNQLIDRFPHNEYADKARSRLADARQNLADHEASVAAFYLKIGEYDSALSRLLTIEQQFPGSNAAKDLRQKIARYFEEETDEIPRHIRRAYRNLPEQAAGAAGLAPGAPEALLARLPLPDARAQLRPNSNPQFGPVNPEQREQRDSSGVIRSASCEDLGGALAFSLNLNAQLQSGEIVRNAAASAVGALAHAKSGQARSGSDTSCSIGGVTFHAAERAAAQGAEVEIRAEGVQTNDVSLLTLDRPKRLVMLISR